MTSVSKDRLVRYLFANHGTEGLRMMRERLVQDGVPLDRAGPTRTAGVQRPPRIASEQDLAAHMRFVASTDSYDISTANGHLAMGVANLFASAVNADGTIDGDVVLDRLGPDVKSAFDVVVARMEAAPVDARRGPATKTQAAGAALPPNALGATRRAPDRGALKIPGDVMRRIPFKNRIADLNHLARLRDAISARAERRDPARRIAREMSTPLQVPRIAGLDALRAQAAITKPLAGAKLFVIQHLYASTQSILDAARDAGVAASDVTVMGKPYSGSMRAAASMVRTGYNVVVPSLHQSEFSDHDEHMSGLIVEQLARLIAEPSPGGKPSPILVVDDGGHVAKLVAERFPAEQHRFKFVEQTQRGANVVREVKGLKAPVVNVAESWAKKEYESPCIAHSVWKETKAVLDRLESSGVSVPKVATVLGYGAIGSHTAAQLKAQGYEVHVHDPDPARAQAATDAGLVAHADKSEALQHAHVLVSATGRTAISIEDAKLLPQRSVMFNAASANNELNATNMLVWQMMAGNALQGTIRIGPKGVEVPRELLFSLDTSVLDEDGKLYDVFGGRDVCLGTDESATQIDRVVHTADGKDLYFAHAGFVINLTDDDDPIPPRYIGVTRSLLFAALLQAAGEQRSGLVDLDPAVQRTIVDATEQALAQTGESLLRPIF